MGRDAARAEAVNIERHDCETACRNATGDVFETIVSAMINPGGYSTNSCLIRKNCTPHRAASQAVCHFGDARRFLGTEMRPGHKQLPITAAATGFSRPGGTACPAKR
jgi:hypothetical protein